MKECCDVLCHNFVDPASIYRILPQIWPDPNRIQIHWIRPGSTKFTVYPAESGFGSGAPLILALMCRWRRISSTMTLGCWMSAVLLRQLRLLLEMMILSLLICCVMKVILPIVSHLGQSPHPLTGFLQFFKYFIIGCREKSLREIPLLLPGSSHTTLVLSG